MARSKRKTSKRASTRRENAAEESVDEIEALEDDSDFVPPEEGDEELEELEELEDEGEELDTLEPWDEAEEEEDDGSVQVAHQLEGVEDCDVQLTLTVGDMEKAAITDAITAPLRRAVRDLGPQLRWRRVRVMFFGDTLIPSAAKQRVAELLTDAKPLEVVVQRGFGDEHVLQNELPAVQWTARPDASEALHMRVTVDTGDLDSDDLPTALRGDVERAAAEAAGKSFEIAFEGSAAPDDRTRELLTNALGDAGASRVALTGGNGAVDVLFDRELEQRVVVKASDDASCDTLVEVELTDDEASTAEAMSLAFPRARPQLEGKRVRVCTKGRTPRPKEVSALLCHAAGMQPASLELESGGRPELLWPMVLTLSQGKSAATVTVDPGGRDAAAIAAALRREAAGLAPVEGRPLTIDWPAGFDVDAATEQVVSEVLQPHRPSSLAYTFGGADREPVEPPGVTLRADGGGMVCELNTDAGKPADIARAVQRRVPTAAGELAGVDVAVHVAGSGAVSRTLRRTLREELEKAGVAGARFVDQGAEDVWLPRLLAFETTGGGPVRITLTPAGRTEAQIETALARELETAESLDGAEVHVLGGDSPAVIEALAERGAGRVLLEGDAARQVHPALFEPAAREGDALTLFVASGPHAAADPVPQLERELPALLQADGGIAGASVTLVWSGRSSDDPIAARAIETIVAGQPEAIFYDEGDGMPMQVWPDLPEPEPEPEPEELPEAVQPEILPEPEPAPAPAAESARVPQVAVLGRRADGSSPMLLLGIDWTQTDAGRAAVQAALEDISADLAGRRVLVVFRAGGRDRAAPDHRPLAQLVLSTVAPHAAALLFHRIPPQPALPYFEVVHSTLEQLSVGTAVRDPRSSATPTA